MCYLHILARKWHLDRRRLAVHIDESDRPSVCYLVTSHRWLTPRATGPQQPTCMWTRASWSLRVDSATTTLHELQQQMKRLETDIAEVCKQWDDYKEFLTGSGDPQYQPHHWQGFSSDRPGSGGAAAALPHSSVAPPPPPEKKQKTTDTLLGTLMPRSCDDMLKAIDDKISNPAITRSSNLTPHGTHDRSIFAVRMDWLSKQMAKATFQKDNPGAQPSTDEDIKNISYAGFMAMGDFLMLDDMELKRFFSWIGNGKSDALTQEEVRALVTETYLRVNVYAFLMTKEKRSFERADSDASQVFA